MVSFFRRKVGLLGVLGFVGDVYVWDWIGVLLFAGWMEYVEEMQA